MGVWCEADEGGVEKGRARRTVGSGGVVELIQEQACSSFSFLIQPAEVEEMFPESIESEFTAQFMTQCGPTSQKGCSSLDWYSAL